MFTKKEIKEMYGMCSMVLLTNKTSMFTVYTT